MPEESSNAGSRGHALSPLCRDAVEPALLQAVPVWRPPRRAVQKCGAAAAAAGIDECPATLQGGGRAPISEEAFALTSESRFM